MSGERTPSEQRLESEARKMLRRLRRNQARIEDLQTEADDLQHELDQLVERESERLGVEVPADALLLDILQLVEVHADGSWTWRGNTNNKQLPVVRYRGVGISHERSVVRVLAEAFGLIPYDWEGLLYPMQGQDNINPWHRQLREFPEGKARGNTQRYTWQRAS